MHVIFRVLAAGALLVSTQGHLVVHGIYLLRKDSVVASTQASQAPGCGDCGDLRAGPHDHDAEADFHATVHREHGDHGGSEGVSPAVLEVRAISPAEATLPDPPTRPETMGGIMETRLVAQLMEGGIFHPPRKGA